MVGCLAATDCTAALVAVEVPKPQAACKAHGASPIVFLITTFSCARLISSGIHPWCELCTGRSWAKGSFPILKKLHMLLIPPAFAPQITLPPSHLSAFPKQERAGEEGNASASRGGREMCGSSAGYLRVEVIEILIFQQLHLKKAVGYMRC